MVETRKYLALTALLLLAACDQSKPAPPQSANVTLTQEQRARIKLYTVAQGSYSREVTTSGTVDFDNNQSTQVLAPFGGMVARLLVEQGAVVKKGDPLASVYSPDYSAAVSSYRKAVTNARNLRRLADMDKDLLTHEGVSQREAAQAESDAVGGEADRDAALQALQSLGVDPQTISDAGGTSARVEGLIRAPLPGTVVEKLISPGQTLQAGTTPAFTVADLSKVWVMAHVFDSDIGSVHQGDSAQVTGAGRTFTGVVDNVGAEVDATTRSVAVRIVVDNPGDALKRQMYVPVKIMSRQQASGLLVPVSAILRDDENLPFVYVAQADGSFARQRVTLGTRSGDKYDLTGLKPGQQVVVDGAIFVQFMQQQ